MPRILFGLLSLIFVVAMAQEASAQTQPSVLGTWTGTVAQNKGSSGYTVVMTLSANGGVTDYPELKCGGALARVGAAKGYVFFTETITRGGKSTGGSCIDGTITVAPASDRLVWGWIGGFNNETYAAWGTLTRK